MQTNQILITRLDGGYVVQKAEFDSVTIAVAGTIAPTESQMLEKVVEIFGLKNIRVIYTEPEAGEEMLELMNAFKDELETE